MKLHTCTSGIPADPFIGAAGKPEHAESPERALNQRRRGVMKPLRIQRGSRAPDHAGDSVVLFDGRVCAAWCSWRASR